ncbi:helix-turn-helix transcriptional regulator [Stenotrophomonas sp.]|uniref:helix-turn-helix domain-containing protein n=1 Tax=Stenotrophomonas sp. TaxID=69392 RepID=UPI0028B1F9B3|nr:helix-turn-helix transcriptional regulator [Stenotrophomonas sp.]
MEDETVKIDGKRIRQLREVRGWSQEHLATLCGLSVRTVQRLEAEGSASLESRMAVASALGVSAGDLLAAPAADTPLAVAAAPIARGRRSENLALGFALLVIALLYGGYNVGKDLAVRDNARCAATPAQCQR